MLSQIAALALAVGLLAATAALPAAGAEAGPRPQAERPFVIMLDPGHGGTNPGCRGHDQDVHEKDITLALAQQVAAEVRTRLPNAEIRLTRSEDRTLTLAERVAIANAARADLLLSLHANASPDANQTGFETYVLDADASSKEAARTARRENEAEPATPAEREASPEAARMLAQLQMTAHRSQAGVLAAAIQRAQAKRFPDRDDRGIKQAPFDVLMGARMPAVLFEAGFLDHAAEGSVLTDPERRVEVARGLADAIVEYYRVARRLQ